MEGPKQKGVNVRDALLKFHNEWYSSNIMTLSILGKGKIIDINNSAAQIISYIHSLFNRTPR